MSVLLDVNGTEYVYPEVNDVSWGADATDWAVAVTSGMLQKAGGLFILLADVDFGTNFGLVSKYFSSRTSNAASTGALRLANTDLVSWRNGANSADLSLSVVGDALLFNGAALGAVGSVTDTARIDLTLTGTALSADIVGLSITNAFISTTAAIAVSKLAALTASRAVATDVNGFITQATTTAAQLDYLASATAALADTTHTGLLSSTDWNTFNGKQASGNYITALTGDAAASGPGSAALTLATVNSNVGAVGSSTAIPVITLNAKGLATAATTAAVVAPAGTLTGTTLAANVVSSSLTSLGTIGTGTWQGSLIGMTYGGTGAALTPANGAIPYSTGSALALLAPGSSGQVLTSGGAGAPTWSSPLTNPMTTAGDIIIGGASGAATRLAGGTSGQWLTYGASNAPAYSDTVIRAKTIDGSADAVQLTVEGHSTQTSNILAVQKSDTTNLLAVTNANGTAIRGSTTNDAAATGFVGEVVQSSITTFTNFAATGTYSELTNISLTAGTWLISVFGTGTRNGGTVTSYRFGIGTASGNNTTGMNQGTNFAEIPSVSGTDGAVGIPSYYVQLASTTTYYLKYSATFSAGTPQAVGRITAVRIR